MTFTEFSHLCKLYLAEWRRVAVLTLDLLSVFRTNICLTALFVWLLLFCKLVCLFVFWHDSTFIYLLFILSHFSSHIYDWNTNFHQFHKEKTIYITHTHTHTHNPRWMSCKFEFVNRENGNKYSSLIPHIIHIPQTLS